MNSANKTNHRPGGNEGRKDDNMWEARAEYADGTSIERLFEDNGLSDAEQQYRLEEWLIERKPDCTWYSVNWINN